MKGVIKKKKKNVRDFIVGTVALGAAFGCGIIFTIYKELELLASIHKECKQNN